MRLSIAFVLLAALAVRAEDPPDPHFLELDLKGSDAWKAECAACSLEKATEMPRSLAEAAAKWLEEHPWTPYVGSVARGLARVPDVREDLARRSLRSEDVRKRMLGQALFAEFAATKDDDIQALVDALNAGSRPGEAGLAAVVRVGARAIPLLKKRYETSNPGMWGDPSGLALALLGGDGLEPLLEKVKDGGEVEAERALWTLAQGGEDAIAKLAALMRDDNIYQRRRAVRVGIPPRAGAEKVLEALELGLYEADEFVARSAAASLARLVKEAAPYWAEGLDRQAAAADAALVRGAAAKAGRGKGECAVALWLLHGHKGDARKDEVVKGVVAALRDPDAGCRAAASDGICGLGGARERLWPQTPMVDEAFAQPLLECAADGDEEVAKAAFWSIRNLLSVDTPVAMTLLLDGACADSANVRLAVATGAPDVCPRLRKAAQEMLETLEHDKDAAVAQRAKEGLARMPR